MIVGQVIQSDPIPPTVNTVISLTTRELLFAQDTLGSALPVGHIRKQCRSEREEEEEMEEEEEKNEEVCGV